MLQLLSLTKWFFVQISIIHDILPSQKHWDAKYIKVYFNNGHLDELKVNWDDNTYTLIYKKMWIEELPAWNAIW
jgi:hypothetical protein